MNPHETLDLVRGLLCHEEIFAVVRVARPTPVSELLTLLMRDGRTVVKLTVEVTGGDIRPAAE